MANDPALHDLFMLLRWQLALNRRDSEEMRLEVAELLRGDDPIPRDARDLLANMFDEHGASDRVLSVKKRNGRPKSANNQAYAIWTFIDERTSNGLHLKAAIDDAMKHFGVGRSTIMEARKAIQEKIDADPQNQLRVEQVRKSRKPR